MMSTLPQGSYLWKMRGGVTSYRVPPHRVLGRVRWGMDMAVSLRAGPASAQPQPASPYRVPHSRPGPELSSFLSYFASHLDLVSNPLTGLPAPAFAPCQSSTLAQRGLAKAQTPSHHPRAGNCAHGPWDKVKLLGWTLEAFQHQAC